MCVAARLLALVRDLLTGNRLKSGQAGLAVTKAFSVGRYWPGPVNCLASAPLGSPLRIAIERSAVECSIRVRVKGAAMGLAVILVILWLVLPAVIGAVAGARGRSGFGWFLLAVLVSPLIAGLILAVLPDLKTRALLEGIVNAAAVDDAALRRAVRRGKRTA
jgi:hypothetical protein